MLEHEQGIEIRRAIRATGVLDNPSVLRTSEQPASIRASIHRTTSYQHPSSSHQLPATRGNRKSQRQEPASKQKEPEITLEASATRSKRRRQLHRAASLGGRSCSLAVVLVDTRPNLIFTKSDSHPYPGIGESNKNRSQYVTELVRRRYSRHTDT